MADVRCGRCVQRHVRMQIVSEFNAVHLGLFKPGLFKPGPCRVRSDAPARRGQLEGLQKIGLYLRVSHRDARGRASHI